MKIENTRFFLFWIKFIYINYFSNFLFFINRIDLDIFCRFHLYFFYINKFFFCIFLIIFDISFFYIFIFLTLSNLTIFLLSYKWSSNFFPCPAKVFYVNFYIIFMSFFDIHLFLTNSLKFINIINFCLIYLFYSHNNISSSLCWLI